MSSFVARIYLEFGVTLASSPLGRVEEEWECPPPRVIKLNCDASFNVSSEIVGFGAVAKDETSEVIDGDCKEKNDVRSGARRRSFSNGNAASKS